MVATQEFSATNTDPKAQIITTLEGTAVGVVVAVLFFYDGPDGGDRFAMFDGIVSTVDLVFNQPFSTFVETVNTRLVASPRGRFNTLPTTGTTQAFVDACLNQTRVSQMSRSSARLWQRQD